MEAHAAWLADSSQGERADLSGADLSRADLSDADLRGADLRVADLRGCILCDTNMDGARVTYRDKTIRIRFEEVKDAT